MKNFYKKWQFWVVAILILFSVPSVISGTGDKEKKKVAKTKIEETKVQSKETQDSEVTSEADMVTPTPENNVINKKYGVPAKAKPTKKPKKKSLKAQVKEAVQRYIDDNCILTDIDYIDVNEDLGAKKKGDYISLIHLIWSGVANETTKENITTFSNDIAARMHKDFPQIQEVTVFWEAKTSGDKAKMAFVRKKKGMYINDEYWDLVFNE